MRISAFYSHLNGLEFLHVHHPGLWQEIQSVISGVATVSCRTKLSKEARILGKLLYAPVAMKSAMRTSFQTLGWGERRTNYWVTSDAKLIRRTMALPAARQKAEIEAAGLVPIAAHDQADLVKYRVAVHVQLGTNASGAHDLFVSFHFNDLIDVGIEILPMRELQLLMSSGVIYYESELSNIIRGAPGASGVPLVLIGIAPDDGK